MHLADWNFDPLRAPGTSEAAEYEVQRQNLPAPPDAVLSDGELDRMEELERRGRGRRGRGAGPSRGARGGSGRGCGRGRGSGRDCI